MFKKSGKKEEGKEKETETSGFEEIEAEEAAVPKKKLPSWVIIPVVGVIILVVAVSSFGGKKSKKTEDNQLNVVEVKKGNVQQIYTSNGSIESENTKTYYSPVTAPVSVCNAQVGKMVKKGDLMISYDTKDLERDNQEAQLTLQSAYNTSRSTREQNTKTIQEAAKASNAANAELANAANSLADQVNDLAARLQVAENTYYASQSEHDSAANVQKRAALQNKISELNNKISEYQLKIETDKTIYDSNGAEYQAALARENDGTATEADKKLISAVEDYQKMVQTDLPKAQADLAQAHAEYAQLDAVDDGGYNDLYVQYTALYEQWRSAYQQAQAGAGTSSESGMSDAEMANLDISDNLAELTAMTPQQLLEKGKEGIKADMDGVISSVQLEGSNTASQGMALFSIASTENVRVKLEVSPDDYANMNLGSTAKIVIGQHEYKGELVSVDRIATQNAKGNPVINARVHIKDPDENICIGATAKVTMTVAESQNTLVIPSEAVNASTDGDFVFVLENGYIKKKPVTLGTSSTTKVEITSGLKEGEQVVDDLNVDVKEGMKATAK